MSSKPKSIGNAEPLTAATRAAEDVSVGAKDEEIRRRAYEIFVERGEEPGRELDDWLRAERELDNTMHSRAQKA
jgi:hypothetical protein